MRPVETATILITDLVNPTGLESRFGPRPADELRREQFTVVRAAIQETRGREVKNTGDGLLAVFGSAAAAVACAISVQQRFERRNRSADEQPLVKVGLSAGDVTIAEDDYFGLPVTEAARLCEPTSRPCLTSSRERAPRPASSARSLPPRS